MRQPFVAPTSMNSMKRTAWPVPRKRRAMSRIDASFSPRLTTTLTFTGEPGLRGCVDPGEHARDREVDVVHRAEDLVVERVEAHRDAREPGVRERLRLLRQERGVRRQRDVESSSSAASMRDQQLEIAAEERLAAGDAELPHAEVDEHARDALDLLEREELAPRQEPVLAAEDLLRHAVDAAEVAAVR